MRALLQWVALLCALEMPGPAQAQADSASALACAAAKPPRAADVRRSDNELRYTEPDRLLDRACARWRAQPTPLAQVLLARALLALNRFEPSQAVLAPLAGPGIASGITPGGTAHTPELSAQLALVQAELARGLGRHAAAAEHSRQALAALAQWPEASSLLRADGLISHAAGLRALSKAGGLDQAAQALAEAETLIVQGGERISWRMTELINEQTLLANSRDDLNSVVRLARAEVAMVRRLAGPNAAGQLDALATLGSTLSTQRKYDEALQALQQGRRIGAQSRAASRSGYAGILNQLAPLLADYGRSAEALEVAQEAVDATVATWGPNSPQLLTPLDRRAHAEEMLQRLAQAQRSHAWMQQLLQAQGEQVPLVRRLRVLDSMAAFQLRMNNVDAAERLINEARALLPADGTLAYWRGRLHRRTAVLAAMQGQWAEAEAQLQPTQELMAVALGAGDAAITYVIALRCEAQVRAGLPSSACDALRGRIDGLRDAAPRERVTARRALARQALSLGRSDEALEWESQALAAAFTDPAQPTAWGALDGVAGLLRERGQRELAVLLGKQAVERIEWARRNISSNTEARQTFLADKYGTYRRLAEWLAEDGRAAEALTVIELLKGQEYGDYVTQLDGAASAAAVTLPYNAAEREWLNAAPMQAPRLQRQPGALDMGLIAQQESERLLAWRQALKTALTVRQPAPEPGSSATPPRELVATVFLGPRHVNWVFQGAGAPRVHRLATDTQALVQDVGRLLAQTERREDVMSLLQSLHRRLFAPVAAEAARLGSTRVLLRPDGELRYVPFAALHDGRAFVLERFTLARQVSGAASAARVLAHAPAAWVNAFGSTQAQAPLPALPGVMAELCNIVDGPLDGADRARDCAGNATRGVLPGRAWIDRAFTHAALRRAAASGQAGRTDVLHIGTHFVLRPGQVSRSWLQLGDGGRLLLQDMLGWQLRSQELVTLSACQTALGGGSEVEGLATLLLQRGARALIASLWPVDDRSTSLLMQHLYRQLALQADPAAALRSAQLQLLADGRGARSHPFHWAGFGVSTALAVPTP
jgi:CHAT domain-containing protein